MKITIIIKPGASKNQVIKIDETNYTVYVTQHPVDGKANKALIEVLAKYFKTAKSNLKIIKGVKSKTKTIEIDCEVPG